MAELAVIIVTWNVRDLALEALRSLYADLAASRLTADVYVVDSASSDGTVEAIAEQFPQVHLTASPENLGFVRGNNHALRQIGFGCEDVGAADLPQAVYLLNPDTITQPGATRALFDALFADRQVGLVGARLTYGDGSFQHSAFAFPGLAQIWLEFFPRPGRLLESRINGRYPRALFHGEIAFPVDFVLGATMMLRREAVEQVGLLDEAFYMYCEEIDWAWRLHKAGWDVLCAPAAHVVHLGGQSTGQARPQSVINLWTSRMLLYRKHLPAWKAWLARWLIVIGMRLRVRQARALQPAERDALIKAYRRVESMARGQ
jgi:GT2 family glycosyltransferase